MKNYNVILKSANNFANMTSTNSDSELICPLSGGAKTGVAVRLARFRPDTSRWELKWGQMAAIALAAGMLSTGSAQASEMSRVALPEAMVSVAGVSTMNNVELFPSIKAVEAWAQPTESGNQTYLLADEKAPASHSNGASGGHTNGFSDHQNSIWPNHSNTGHNNGQWPNHANASGGHSNNSGGTDTNQASDGAHTNNTSGKNVPYEFGHVNLVQGDYIF